VFASVEYPPREFADPSILFSRGLCVKEHFVFNLKYSTGKTMCVAVAAAPSSRKKLSFKKFLKNSIIFLHIDVYSISVLPPSPENQIYF